MDDATKGTLADLNAVEPTGQLALVTGGLGFLGRHLVTALIARGMRVAVLDRGPAQLDPRWPVDRVVPIECDLTRYHRPIDLGGLIGRNAPAFAFPHQIWHLASHASPQAYKLRAIETLQLGTQTTNLLCELALVTGAKLLFTSSSEVYGDATEVPTSEGYRGNVACYGPRAMYDESKRAGEAICQAWHQQHGVDARIVRIFNTYGPGQDLHDGRLVPSLMKAALTNEPFYVHGTGGQTRSLCYVADTIAGMLMVMDHEYPPGAPREPVNIGGGAELSVLDLVQEVVSVTGRSIRLITAPPQDEHDPGRRCPDTSRARAMGWTPWVPLREGLAMTWDSLTHGS